MGVVDPKSDVQREMARMEREERRAWGHPDQDGIVRSVGGVRTRAAFRTHLRAAPTGLVTQEQAAIYAREIQDVLDMDCWTRNEQADLYRLRRLWQRRANGEDTRFRLRGVFADTALGPNPRTGQHKKGLTPAECAEACLRLLEPSREAQSTLAPWPSDAERYAPSEPTESMTQKVKKALKDVGKV